MIADFISLIFTETCSSCGFHLFKNESFLCLKCYHKLPKTDFHKEMENVLARRLWGKFPLTYALAYLKYYKGGSVQKMLYQIKYKGNKEGATFLGKWYGNDLRKEGLNEKFDCILPVPLHKKRFQTRGFNQSEYFAKGLSSSLDIPLYVEVLKREIHKKSQTGMGRFERWQNVKDVYEVHNPELVRGKKILLADDVITTGATLEACAEKLIVAGVKEINIVAMAVAE
jgi:ComF family protein